MTTTYRQQRQRQTPSALWPALLVVGLAVTVLGLLLILNPFATAGTLAVLAGVALVLSGIGETIAAARAENSAGTAFFGILLVLGGIVVLLWPGVTLRVLALLVGAILIVTGVVRALVTRALQSHELQSRELHSRVDRRPRSSAQLRAGGRQRGVGCARPRLAGRDDRGTGGDLRDPAHHQRGHRDCAGVGAAAPHAGLNV